ncbi:MAG: hypothetical protein J6Y43_07075, partial [Clostridia bacterium]|nr:hypothetical protein [Clostridia bacterium]
MKVATKRFLLGILAAVFAICVGFIISGNAHSAAYADDATVINLTMQNTQYQNNAENAGAYYTSLCFLHTDNHAEYGVSTGNYTSGTTPDYSDILSKTVYTGSENTVLYRSAVFWGWAADTKSSTFRFIYIGTVNAPAAGDRITISAGAWFITGGTINDKYVISTDIILEFDGSAWVYYAPFTLGNDLWSGADQSGGKGVQLTAWGIENDGNAAAYPTAGTFALLNSGVFAAGPTANQASNITGIKYNGTPIKDVA